MGIETKKFEQPQNYQPFDPEAELEELKKCDKETKGERLKEYKEELIRQKEGIAGIQIDLEKQIRGNPDLSQEELMKTVFAKAHKFRLSKDQLDLFDETLDKYVEMHQAIKEAREKYPDDKKLFKACFGKKPRGEIEIIEGPTTLYLRCRNLKDYVWVLQEKFLVPEEEQEITETDLKIAEDIGANKVSNCLIPSLRDVISVAKPSEGLSSASRTEFFKHEEQHTIETLYKEQQFKFKDKLLEEFKAEKTPEHLVRCLRDIRRVGQEDLAKNEIIAFYKGASYLEEIKDTLLRSAASGGLYDYFDQTKDYLKQDLKKEGGEFFDKNKEAIEKILNQVFVDEYRLEINKAINAIEELEKMGKSKDEIISLLITEPLSQWGKLVKRMKEMIISE